MKIEQGKLNDQANTLADLAKVSKAGRGVGSLGQSRLVGSPGRKGNIQ